MRQQLFFQTIPSTRVKQPWLISIHRGDSFFPWLSTWRGMEWTEQLGGWSLMLAGPCVFILSPDVSYFCTPGCAKRESIPLHSIRAHLFFQCHVNETLSPSMPREKKNELLKNFWTELHSVTDGNILKEKAKLKLHACSKKVFQNWQKDPRQCIYYMTGKEWTFKWIYLETNEPEFLLCFLKIKKILEAYTWEHISSGERNSALLFFPLWK